MKGRSGTGRPTHGKILLAPSAPIAEGGISRANLSAKHLSPARVRRNLFGIFLHAAAFCNPRILFTLPPGIRHRSSFPEHALAHRSPDGDPAKAWKGWGWPKREGFVV